MRAMRIYLNIIGSAITNVLGVLAFMAIARFSGADVLGILGYWSAFVGTFGFLMCVDIESAHLRIIPSLKTAKEKGRAIGAYATLKFTFIVFSFIILILLLLLYHSSEAISEIEMGIFIIIFLSVALASYSNIFIMSFAAYGQTARQIISSIVGMLIKNIMLIILAIVGASVILLSASYIIGASITLMIAVILFRNYPFSLPTRKEIRAYLSIGGPLMLAPILTNIIINLDKIMLREFWDTSDVGIYFLFQSIALSFIVIGRSMTYVMIPGFSEDITIGKTERLRNQCNYASRLLLLLFVPLIIFILFFSGPYLSFFLGESFRFASSMFAILIVGSVFMILSHPLASILVARGRQLLILKSTALGLLASIISLILLVPESINDFRLLGLAGLGASISFCLSSLIQFIFYWKSNREIRCYIVPKQLMTILVVSLISVLVILISNSLFNIAGLSILSLIISPFLFIGITIYLSLQFGVLSRDDLKFIVRTISLGKIYRYIKDEINGGYHRI